MRVDSTRIRVKSACIFLFSITRMRVKSTRKFLMCIRFFFFLSVDNNPHTDPIKKYAQTSPSQDEVSLFLFMNLVKQGHFQLFFL
jgi:hypothetical protein